MMRKTCFVLITAFSLSCGNELPPPPPEAVLPDISEIETLLPYASGRELVEQNCLTCHSAAYIKMQPDFPRKTWQKTVDKMVKTFGAPIDTSNIPKIVDYLMEIKGIHSPPAQVGDKGEKGKKS